MSVPSCQQVPSLGYFVLANPLRSYHLYPSLQSFPSLFQALFMPGHELFYSLRALSRILSFLGLLLYHRLVPLRSYICTLSSVCRLFYAEFTHPRCGWAWPTRPRDRGARRAPNTNKARVKPRSEPVSFSSVGHGASFSDGHIGGDETIQGIQSMVKLATSYLGVQG